MKYLKIIVVLACVFLIARSDLQAQQENQFTQYMFNKLVLNPAYAGARNLPSINALYRAQWLGFEGRPESKQINFDIPIVYDRVGFGLSLVNHQHGIFDNWYASMSYSYKLKLDDLTHLSVGLSGTLRNLSLDFTDPGVRIKDPDDPSLAGIEGTDFNQWKGNFGIGAYFTHDHFYLGASVPNMFPNEIGVNLTGNATAEESPHFYAMAGAMFPTSQSIHVKPSVLLKYVDNAPLDLDLGLSLVFNLRFHAGLNYRFGGDGSGDSIDLLAFYQASDQIGIGAAYDFTLSELNRQTDGSIEVLLRIDLKKQRGYLANPRFFE